jgi:hypothetical protein
MEAEVTMHISPNVWNDHRAFGDDIAFPNILTTRCVWKGWKCGRVSWLRTYVEDIYPSVSVDSGALIPSRQLADM